MDRQTEIALVRRAAKGDRAASEALIRHFQPSLYAFLLRYTGRPDVAEDITQDAFVRVLSNLERFDPKWRFSTWLFTIARRAYMNRSAKHRPINDSDVGEHFSADLFSHSIATQRGPIRDALQTALLDLPEVQREIVVLFYQYGWSIRLIASTLGYPEGTVKSHLHRGRRRLRDLFDRNASLRAIVEEAWA